MKTNLIFIAIIFIITLLYVGHLQISVKPLNVSLPYWHRSLGILLMIAGVYTFSIGEHVSGYSKGLNDGADRVINLIKEKESNHEQAIQGNYFRETIPDRMVPFLFALV